MKIAKKSIKDLPDTDIKNKKILLRTDYNVPLSHDGSITSDYRIRESLPTLNYLLEREACVIIVSHLGRPKGEADSKFSLKPVVGALQNLLPQVTIKFAETATGEPAIKAASNLKPGEILLLENIRFEPGETKNDPSLAKQLAELADVYVNDAFGAAHRAHASTAGIAQYLPVKVAGLLMKKELDTLSGIMESPEKPFTAIIGGSKISTKIGVLSNLLKHVNNLVIGGGMVFTFLKAKGYEVGSSLIEEEQVETAGKLLKEAENSDKIIVLPRDVVVADRFADDANHKTVYVQNIPEGWMGLDLGPESTERICDILKNSRTVFWNGPLGVFEFPTFAKSTKVVAETLADLTDEDILTSVLGGGDTQAAIEIFQIPPSRYKHVSTGGGATIELLEGKILPGVDVLDDRIISASYL